MQGSSTRLPALFTLALSLALLGFSIPYGVAFGRVLPFQQDVDTLQTQLDAARPDFPRVIAMWDQAVATYPDPRLQSDLALLRLQQGRMAGVAPVDLWKALAADYRALLKVRPLAPLDWARLAYVSSLAGDARGARWALSRSFRTGRYAPGYMLWRYTQALQLMDEEMTQQQRDQLGDQTGLLLRKKTWDLIRMARLGLYTDKIEGLVRTYHPARLEDFLRKRGAVGHTKRDGPPPHPAP